jgi:hypothetical protein
MRIRFRIQLFGLKRIRIQLTQIIWIRIWIRKSVKYPSSVPQIEYLGELLESGELVGLPVRASPPTVTLPRIKVRVIGGLIGTASRESELVLRRTSVKDPGSLSRIRIFYIPKPNFSHPGSGFFPSRIRMFSIPDPNLFSSRSPDRIKEFKF